MDSSQTRSGPRLLVPAIIVALALAIRFVPGWVAPFTLFHFISLGVGPILGILGLLVWWVFAKGLSRRDRWLGLLCGIGLLALGFVLGHRSMPQVLVAYGLVVVGVVFVGALFATRALSWSKRRTLVVLALALAWLPWLALRQDGQIGELTPQLSPRWAPTAEDVFMESRGFLESHGASGGTGAVATSLDTAEADWPGFRGPERDAQVRGVSFAIDWQDRPPREVWRRRVGPGWSSFAVVGGRVYTQEQRGAQEAVVCYSLIDGSELWARADETRFEEAASGAGPRATPTFDRGVLYALGAKGALQALDAATGERIWRRDLGEDVEAPLPVWGFASSPLVVGEAVLAFAGGDGGRGVVAYHRETGELLWSSGEGALSYGSAHLATIGGIEQVLMSSDKGLEAFDPEDGTPLWEFVSPLTGSARIVQPVVLEDGASVILATGFGVGSKRLRLERDAAGSWAVEEVWSSRFLKPYFNGLACHEGTCYGFDGKILTAIGADDGERRWKGGRYGHGQLVLLPDMDMLLVISETGEVVLVEASSEAHREVARFQALEGKTWNHPVVTRGKLLVRNAAEAACFDLPI